MSRRCLDVGALAFVSSMASASAPPQAAAFAAKGCDGGSAEGCAHVSAK